MTRGLAIGVDIGGTKVAAGVVDVDGAVLARARRETPHRASPRVVEDTIVEVVEELPRVATTVVAVGIGAAGFVDADRATVLFAPHLAWRNEPLRDALDAPVGLPVVVENDANAAAWAEWRFGAGPGRGAARLRHPRHRHRRRDRHRRRVQRGRYGMAGEFGHMVVVPDGHRCECGNRGCLEQYASRQRPRCARRASWRGRVAGRRRRCWSGSAATSTRWSARSSPRRPGTATRPRSSCSRRSAAGSGSAWPTSRRRSTPGGSSSAAASPRRASCCSARRASRSGAS